MALEIFVMICLRIRKTLGEGSLYFREVVTCGELNWKTVQMKSRQTLESRGWGGGGSDSDL